LGGRGSLYDTSVWIALAFSAHPLHAPAKAAFLAASPAQPALFCRATQQSALRLLSTPAIATAYGVPALSNHDALAVLAGFMASPSVGFVDEPANVFPRWQALADLPTPSPKRWMDAYLAAFALAAALPFVTGDSDFNAFAGLSPTVLVAPVSSTPATPASPPAGGASGVSSP
jgi:toxin-antitoxin system PIN domain toxin